MIGDGENVEREMGIHLKPDESASNSLKTNSRLHSLGFIPCRLFIMQKAIYIVSHCVQSMDFLCGMSQDYL